MVVVGCAGFPVPVSQYWEAFDAVEISETKLGVPGAGTLRRWVREAGPDYVFSILAPGPVTDSSFEVNELNRELLEQLAPVGDKLNARAIVFRAEEFKRGKANKQVLDEFVAALPDGLPPAAFELPGWSAVQIEEVTGDRAVAVRNPITDGPPDGGVVCYFRLPGPAGRRSRYDEEAMAQIYDACKSSGAKETLCIFANADMQVNATSLREKLAKKR